MTSQPSATLIVPCFNEARRLKVAQFKQLSATRGLSVLFVDDGSTDDTAAVLAAVCADSQGQASLLRLPKNSGKSEAVRQGLNQALNSGAAIVGFADADLATPVEEIVRLWEELSSGRAQVVMGSRVKLLGVEIERRGIRHYLGRLFATIASLVLRLDVYDTQCGAKFFRAHPALTTALGRPFESRWIFDVELISRLLRPGASVTGLTERDFLEVPLRIWRHVPGSKLRPLGMMRAALELFWFWIKRT